MDKKISVIITKNYDISAITSLLQSNNDSWECFIINNSVKNIDQFIINNNKFKIFNDSQNPHIINDAINRANGEYILLLDASDILVSDIFDAIFYISDFTNSDIIKFRSQNEYINTDKNTRKKYKFKYVFKKQTMMDCVFNSLSEFCFKKDVIKDIDFTNAHSFLTAALLLAKDMGVSQKNCIVHTQNNAIIAPDIIDNYQRNHDKLSDDFWKKYFKILTPIIIKQLITNNDKESFVEFCKQIPLRLIPLRYRPICYILKKTNK